ncbi:MAG: hypothetical protein LIO96_01860 [Lachnospiraceae bacterium]|nr:hypothetical protein [Lachnospiraceae bacterium]
MARNKKYLANAILLCVLGVVLMFLYSGLQSDHINIITAFSSWSSNAIQYPLTVGNFICIPLTFVYGSLFMKYGVKKPLIPYSFASLMMSALITMGKAKTAYGILVVIIIVGIVALFPMLKMKDANAADRMYGEK